jgi:hypothetical protein
MITESSGAALERGWWSEDELELAKLFEQLARIVHSFCITCGARVHSRRRVRNKNLLILNPLIL